MLCNVMLCADRTRRASAAASARCPRARRPHIRRLRVGRRAGGRRSGDGADDTSADTFIRAAQPRARERARVESPPPRRIFATASCLSSSSPRRRRATGELITDTSCLDTWAFAAGTHYITLHHTTPEALRPAHYITL